MAHESDDWRPDKVRPRDYPPPPRPATLWEPAQADTFDPRDGLRRCLADVEASAQRLRAMIERLGP